MSDIITIALAKGRLAEETIELMEKAGYNCQIAKTKTRKLILEDQKTGFRFIMAKPSDVPTYVEYGAADIGVVGKDTLLEQSRNLYEVIDLGFGACKMCVCGLAGQKSGLENYPNKRVATKYPHITRTYFQGVKRETVEIIKLNGSVELAPLVGLAEMIVDIVESGQTLKENGLEVWEDIASISARLIVNRVSMKMKAVRIHPLIDDIKKQLQL